MQTQQDINNEQARQFAAQYQVFVDDPRGRNLLDHWRKAVLGRVLPSNASHCELAYHEGRRAFVLAIEQQVTLGGETENPFA